MKTMLLTIIGGAWCVYLYIGLIDDVTRGHQTSLARSQNVTHTAGPAALGRLRH